MDLVALIDVDSGRTEVLVWVKHGVGGEGTRVSNGRVSSGKIDGWFLDDGG